MKWLFAHWRAMALFFVGMGLAGAAAFPFAGWFTVPSRLERVRKDYQEIWKASAALGLDNCGLFFPDDTHLRHAWDPAAPLTFERRTSYARQGKILWGMRCLTTPVAYLDQLPEDPFNPGHDYGYTSFGNIGRGDINHLAVMSSPGPNGKNDLDLGVLRESICAELNQNSKHSYLHPGQYGTIRKWIDPYLYDPSNGTRSGGDLILVMDTHRRFYGFGWFSKASPEWADPIWPYREDPINPQRAKVAGSDVPAADPPLTEEEKTWIADVDVPLDLYKLFKAAGIYTSSTIPGKTGPAAIRYAINEERVNRLKNHLGPFQDFFERPAALTSTSLVQKLEGWKREDPKWWQAMSIPSTGTYTIRGKTRGDWAAHFATPGVTAYDIYPVIILYGKSQLLEAAAEAGRDQAALSRIAPLREMMRENRISNSRELRKLDAMIDRIHVELVRLCDELEATIKMERN